MKPVEILKKLLVVVPDHKNTVEKKKESKQPLVSQMIRSSGEEDNMDGIINAGGNVSNPRVNLHENNRDSYSVRLK